MSFSTKRKVLVAAFIGVVMGGCGRTSGSRVRGDHDKDGRESGPEHHPVELSLVCNLAGASKYELHLKLDREGIRNVHGLLMEGHVLGQFIQPKTTKKPSDQDQVQQRAREISQTADCLKQSLAKPAALDFKVQLPRIETSAILEASTLPSSQRSVEKSWYLEIMLGELESALSANQWPQVHRKMVNLAAALKIAKQNYAGRLFQVQEADEKFAALKAKYAPQGVLLCPEQYNPIYAMETISVANQVALKSMLNQTCVHSGDHVQKKQLRAYLAYLQFMNPNLLGIAWESVRHTRDGATMATALGKLVKESVQKNLVEGLSGVERVATESRMSMAELRASFVKRTLEIRYGERVANELSSWLLYAIDDAIAQR
jgi:hypothetical protein